MYLGYFIGFHDHFLFGKIYFLNVRLISLIENLLFQQTAYGQLNKIR